MQNTYYLLKIVIIFCNLIWYAIKNFHITFGVFLFLLFLTAPEGNIICGLLFILYVAIVWYGKQLKNRVTHKKEPPQNHNIHIENKNIIQINDRQKDKD